MTNRHRHDPNRQRCNGQTMKVLLSSVTFAIMRNWISELISLRILDVLERLSVQQSSSNNPSSPTTTTRIAKAPDAFQGSPKELENFLSSCVFYMDAYPDSILRDEIARNQDFDPKSIDELMDFIIHLDNRLREREKERREIRFSEQRYLSRTSAFRPTPTASQGMQTTTSTQHFGPGPLPNDEKERRRSNNLCMYCGNPGHTTDACPKKGKAPARRL
ncbi:Hypothetical Protein CGB_B5230W [Cryptococcus gattii WM276]|uniref:CCHC-type domain-containing protein n=2 Tax=Cryptococcus gattii TaxID=37769 RepID=E6R0X0_CRYGW|nr:Hypothetical Protein CGB_B5230W [Cryptococcus gattii WM276]ADV20459.1 Hypothetical Protein CGB_B5230W [Cryptococcus gattii WM276]KIR77063.1 hypothetical protein I306_06001 [Cryptococcus gattii EJB2]